MKKMECTKGAGCIWALRFEIIGIILLIIATCLTIRTYNGLGIAALFIAGVVLCIFNKFCCYAYPSKDTTCPHCGIPHSCSSDAIENTARGKTKS